MVLVRRRDDGEHVAAARSPSHERRGVGDRRPEQRRQAASALRRELDRRRGRRRAHAPRRRPGGTRRGLPRAPHSTQLSRCGRNPDSQRSLSWNERTSGSSAGRRPGCGSRCVERVEEPRQREERAVVPLLLGEQPQHRLEPDEADLEPVAVGADPVVRTDERCAGDRSELPAAAVEAPARRARTARGGRRTGSSSGGRPSPSPRSGRWPRCRGAAPGPPREGNERSTTASVIDVPAMARVYEARASAPLAARAEPGPAAADDGPLDRSPAAVARLAEPAVDMELVLHPAAVAVGRNVVAESRPLELDAATERRADRTVQAARPRRGRARPRVAVDGSVRARAPRPRRCSRSPRGASGRGGTP